MTLAIAKEDPGLGIGIVGLRLVFRPFRHLGAEDVEVAVAIDIGHVEAMAMNDVAASQVVAHPSAGILRISVALEPLERPNPVARRDHDLRDLAGLEFSGGDAAAHLGHFDGLELRTTEVLEPIIPREQIDLAVAVDVEGGHAFGISGRAFAGFAGENFRGRPGLGVSGVGRDVGEEDGLGALVPKRQLGFACPLEVPENLVVVLRGAALLYYVPFPRDVGIEIRKWIFPPPDLAALPIAAEDDIQVAVAIDVVNRAAGFDCKEVFVKDEARPTSRRTAIPDQRGGLLAKAEHEVIGAVLIKVGHDGARLLRGLAWNRQLAILAGEVLPLQVGP